MHDHQHDDQQHDEHRPAGTGQQREAALERSGLNPNVEDPTAAGRGTAGTDEPRRGEPGQAAPPDPEAPARSVDDTTSPEAVEPNEPA